MKKVGDKYCMYCRSLVEIEKVKDKGLCVHCKRCLYDFSFVIDKRRSK